MSNPRSVYTREFGAGRRSLMILSGKVSNSRGVEKSNFTGESEASSLSLLSFHSNSPVMTDWTRSASFFVTRTNHQFISGHQ